MRALGESKVESFCIVIVSISTQLSMYILKFPNAFAYTEIFYISMEGGGSTEVSGQMSLRNLKIFCQCSLTAI